MYNDPALLRLRYHLAISRRRRGDYKLISEHEVVLTEPEATNCFILNFQVNIMILSRNFYVYLHFTPLFTSWT